MTVAHATNGERIIDAERDERSGGRPNGIGEALVFADERALTEGLRELAVTL